MNARDLLWMEQKEWWFIKDFDLPRLDGTWRLTFEGVNYRAEAWLNDVQIGVWEGSFLTMKIDLDPKLLLKEGNRLAVRCAHRNGPGKTGPRTIHGAFKTAQRISVRSGRRRNTRMAGTGRRT
jgi:beta-galactosidase/beta-glucuronidase